MEVRLALADTSVFLVLLVFLPLYFASFRRIPLLPALVPADKTSCEATLDGRPDRTQHYRDHEVRHREPRLEQCASMPRCGSGGSPATQADQPGRICTLPSTRK